VEKDGQLMETSVSNRVASKALAAVMHAARDNVSIAHTDMPFTRVYAGVAMSKVVKIMMKALIGAGTRVSATILVFASAVMRSPPLMVGIVECAAKAVIPAAWICLEFLFVPRVKQDIKR